jgi:hypothetical protein
MPVPAYSSGSRNNVPPASCWRHVSLLHQKCCVVAFQSQWAVDVIDAEPNEKRVRTSGQVHRDGFVAADGLAIDPRFWAVGARDS